MLSYIDIEAFSTTTYRVVSKPNTALSAIETETATISHIQTARQRQQITKHLVSTSKPVKTKRAI